MRHESAASLKQELLADVLDPIAALARRVPIGPTRAVRLRALTGGIAHGTVFAVGARPLDAVPALQRSIALGIAPKGDEFHLAIRVQRQGLLNGPLVAQLVERARGEADVRLIGRVDKRTPGLRQAPTRSAKLRSPARSPRDSRPRRVPIRARALDAGVPWFQRQMRPLLIGASVGHTDVTAGTIGAFVSHDGRTCLLSNNHVLANEDRANVGEPIVQPGTIDRGRTPADQIAAFLIAIELDPASPNFVDAALAELVDVDHDSNRLREIVGSDRVLAGLGPDVLDKDDAVHKIGRTTGATEGRVTAFELDNVVVNYDVGNVRFDGQVEIEGIGNRAFSDGGDSGALIVNGGMEAVALLFAGTESGGTNGLGLTYANPIHRVLDEIDATLLF